MNRVLYQVMGRFRHRVLGQPSCKEVNGFLAELLEGSLGEDLAKKYHAHLDTCPPCGALFEQYKRTVEMARESRDEKIPEDLVAHTLAFLRQRRND